jgi:glyoxylase-like metal-dependent hydrolase (beta-lactamase superfamily II)
MFATITIPFPEYLGKGEATHVYLLKDENTVLIDTGLDSKENRTFIKNKLKELNISTIDYILLTHGHIDHFGLANYLQKEFGAEILIHKLDKDKLEDYRNAIKWFDENYELIIEGGYSREELNEIKNKLINVINMIELPESYRTYENLKLNIGRNTITSIHLPGHTPGSVGYSIDDTIFCGDAAIEGSTAIENFRKELDSLQKLKCFNNIYPSHKKIPLTRKDIEKLENHFIDRLEEIIKITKNGMRLKDIVIRIYGDKIYESPIRALIPIRQVISYLLYLEEEGYVIRKGYLWISTKDSL